MQNAINTGEFSQMNEYYYCIYHRFFLFCFTGDASNLVKRSLKDTVQCIEDGRFYR